MIENKTARGRNWNNAKSGVCQGRRGNMTDIETARETARETTRETATDKEAETETMITTETVTGKWE